MSSLRTSEIRFRRLIDAVAAYEQLPRWGYKGDQFTAGELLEGLILTESSGNPVARRYEPHQDAPGRKDQAQDPDTAARDDGPLEDDASYGLMQVMGYTFKGLLQVDRAVKMRFDLLFLPLFGLAAGVEVLKRELRAVYAEDTTLDEDTRVVKALARYNGGPTGDDWILELGDIRRREYVDLVAKNAKRAQDDRRAMGWRVA